MKDYYHLMKGSEFLKKLKDLTKDEMLSTIEKNVNRFYGSLTIRKSKNRRNSFKRFVSVDLLVSLNAVY